MVLIGVLPRLGLARAALLLAEVRLLVTAVLCTGVSLSTGNQAATLSGVLA